jgi:hypothetical protein
MWDPVTRYGNYHYVSFGTPILYKLAANEQFGHTSIFGPYQTAQDTVIIITCPLVLPACTNLPRMSSLGTQEISDHTKQHNNVSQFTEDASEGSPTTMASQTPVEPKALLPEELDDTPRVHVSDIAAD